MSLSVPRGYLAKSSYHGQKLQSMYGRFISHLHCPVLHPKGLSSLKDVLHEGKAHKGQCETCQYHRWLLTNTHICLGELLLHASSLTRLHSKAARRSAVVSSRATSCYGAGARTAEEPAVCAGRRGARSRGRVGREDHDSYAVRDDGCRRGRAVVHVTVPVGTAAASAVGGETAVKAGRTARLGVVALRGGHGRACWTVGRGAGDGACGCCSAPSRGRGLFFRLCRFFGFSCCLFF